MADVRPSIVVGAFSNRKQADEAISALQKAGFRNDQIRQFTGTGKGTEHGPLTGIKNIFSPERMARGDITRDLMDLGVTPEDTPFYQQEYEAGHPLVSVSSTKRLPEAAAVLLNNNAYVPAGTHTGAGRSAQRDTQTIAGQEQSRTIPVQERTRTVSGQEQLGTIPAQERTRTVSGQEQSRTISDQERTRTVSDQERARIISDQERARAIPGQERTRTISDQEAYENLQKEQHMRLHAEQIQAYKQPTQVGEVILRKEVVTDQQTIDVPVSHEEVVIERRSITGEAAATEEQLGDGQVIRIPVSEDRVNLTKRIVTTGEVVVGKREREEIQHFSDTVQHEEAHWEQKGDAHIIWEKGPEQPPPTQRGL
jgi:uncharacterized protein (TIGR02271 family)